MDNSANKALTIGVAVFITIMITSAILFILGRMQEVYSRVYETDISIQNQFDEYDAFDSTTKTGIEVYNAVKKYVGNQFVTITFKGNLILEKGEFNSSKMSDDELKRRIKGLIFGSQDSTRDIGEGLAKSTVTKVDDFVTIDFN
ncbi:unknown [Clostridium sp. CAG:921]|nr:unknown [Clostridium sp. CAG:921]